MDNQKIRVFVSFSTQDSQIVDRIIDHLKKDDFVVFSSHVIPKGREYRDNIKDQIAYTHSFLLILTQSAANSSWVNQEVGIALALQVPILVVRFPTAESQDSGSRHRRRETSYSGGHQFVWCTGQALRAFGAIDPTRSQAPAWERNVERLRLESWVGV